MARYDKEREKTAEWLLDGFNLYVVLGRKSSAVGSQKADEAADTFLRYGQVFADIIADKNYDAYVPEVNTETLYADLAKLQNDGCPAVDIVELALRCTAGGPQNVEEALLLF